MFYSQFILAKKGPLGTIWIAAHLERKLRKNQIADTDIGVSVDSILFPDMPIALRLSSHLLLGVVRIYSKQVNYLFDDCSEALLKVKQAFRSAAVDLPPEESTAPYNSITLPETFDLDDFELPETDIFLGNYVDHHISAKEQITLQDTMEGAVYSTSQFGLDERFGDDDTSRLDLDEELFMEKVTGPIVDEDMPISYVEGQPSNPGIIHLKDEDQEMLSDSPEQPIADAENEVGQFDLDDYAQPPSTPGLLEEPNLSNIQEVSACEDHMEVEDQIIQEQAVDDNLLNATSKWPKDETMLENDCQRSGQEITQLAEFDGTGKDGELVSDLNPHGLDETISTPIFSQHTPVLESCDVTGNPDLSNSVVNDNDSSKNSENHVNVQNLLPDNVVASNAENLQQNPLNEVASEEIQLEVNETCFPQEPEKACMEEPLSPEKPPAADSSKLDALENVNFDDTDWRSLDMSNISDLPAPERLLSVPEGLSETLEYSMVDFTPNIANTESSNGDGAGENLISGKKRTFTESTLSVPSLISVESYEPEQSKRTKGSVPDDDDLLSSILGGRIPSVLKMKPTPTPSELTLTKRPRTVARSTASKKRVLMDDSMVLHGDMIRQQLMNTEDIRRQRKKAPCTRREICMIQKDLLEIEIFMDPIITGLSADFVSLHGQMRDLSQINIYKSVAKRVSSMGEADLQNNNDGIEHPMEGGPELINSELTGKEIIHTSTVAVNDEEVDLLHVSHAEEQMDNLVGVLGPEFTAEEITNTSELDLRGTSTSVDEVCPADNGPVSVSMDQLPPEAIDDTASLQTDTLVMIHEQELKALSFGTTEFDVAEKNGDSIMLDNEQKAKDGFFSEEIQADVSIETCWPVEDGGHGLNFNPCLLEENGKEDDKIENINDTVTEELNHNVLNQNPLNFEDEPKIDTAIVVDHDMNMIHEPSKDSECHDCEGYPSLVADVTPTDCPTMEDNDFNYQDGHDTEFLNVDDDDAYENDDDCIPNGEQAGVMENSGWSSRTRAVAKYLQTAFEKESIQGRKVLAMDNLLVGRTRKEASRMFFEALVLKTKDFIQVEQGVAFNNINITSRGKLMKSDF